MNLIKYSPNFQNLKRKDLDAFYLFMGFIRQNSSGKIPYAILSLILKHWNSIKIIKLLQLTDNEQRELDDSMASFTIKNCQYKVAIFLNKSISVHIYPFTGLYNLKGRMNSIKTEEGSSWKALEKNILIKFEIYKSNYCQEKCLKNKKEPFMKIYLDGGTESEGIIVIKRNSILGNGVILEMMLWEEDQLHQYSICKQCQCSDKSKKGWIFVDKESEIF